MTTIGQRLTAEREAEIREVATYNPRPPLAPYLYEDLRVLLAELDATRAERDEARRDEAYLIEKVALNAQQRDDAIHDLDEALKANKELNAALMKEAAAVDEARKDSERLDFLDSCDLRALTSIIGMAGDGNAIRGQIDRERAAAIAKANV